MILFIQKCFSLPMRFSLCIPARQVAGFVLTLLLVISLMTAAQAEEESEIVTDAQVSLEQMAQSAESEVQTHRAELADLFLQLVHTKGGLPALSVRRHRN